jgi:hypothetical protein
MIREESAVRRKESRDKAKHVCKLLAYLDQFFVVVAFIGCVGLINVISEQGLTIKGLAQENTAALSLADQRMKRIEALHTAIDQQNERISLLLDDQRRQRGENNAKIDAIGKIIRANKRCDSSGVLRATLNQLRTENSYEPERHDSE